MKRPHFLIVLLFSLTAQAQPKDGRRLDRKPTQKGVYIRNGKKVILK